VFLFVWVKASKIIEEGIAKRKEKKKKRAREKIKENPKLEFGLKRKKQRGAPPHHTQAKQSQAQTNKLLWNISIPFDEKDSKTFTESENQIV